MPIPIFFHVKYHRPNNSSNRYGIPNEIISFRIKYNIYPVVAYNDVSYNIKDIVVTDLTYDPPNYEKLQEDAFKLQLKKLRNMNTHIINGVKGKRKRLYNTLHGSFILIDRSDDGSNDSTTKKIAYLTAKIETKGSSTVYKAKSYTIPPNINDNKPIDTTTLLIDNKNTILLKKNREPSGYKYKQLEDADVPNKIQTLLRS